MAKHIGDEEILLKQRGKRRLIGAVALAALMVVVLPLVLDDRPKPIDHDVAIDIPDPDADGFTSKVIPIETPPVDAAVSSAVTPTPLPPVSNNTAVRNRTLTIPSAPAPAKPVTVAKAPAPAKTAAPGFVVQLGAFTDDANAKLLRDRLASQGISAYKETFATAQGNKTRVRAGPYASREQAEKIMEKLRAMGVNGIVVDEQG
ncbi:MAG: SPOR domain-containing protein [Burkholderiales bacterium]